MVSGFHGCGESELIKGTTAVMCGIGLARCFVGCHILLAKLAREDIFLYILQLFFKVEGTVNKGYSASALTGQLNQVL